MSRLIALAALGLMGCQTYSTEYVVHLDHQFSPAQVATIEQAGGEWVSAINQQRLGGLMLSYKVDGCNGTDRKGWSGGNICLHYSSSLQVLQGYENNPEATEPKGYYFTGYTNRDPNDASDIWIAMDDPDVMNGKMGLVVGHELGHALGLNHANGLENADYGNAAPGSIMFWVDDYPESSSTPTFLDTNQYLWLRDGNLPQLFILYH